MGISLALTLGTLLSMILRTAGQQDIADWVRIFGLFVESVRRGGREFLDQFDQATTTEEKVALIESVAGGRTKPSR